MRSAQHRDIAGARNPRGREVRFRAKGGGSRRTYGIAPPGNASACLDSSFISRRFPIAKA
jgi:hypothetical protein